MNFAVNVAGTYTITELLITSLERAAPEARVITVASGGMLTEPLSDDLQVSHSFSSLCCMTILSLFLERGYMQFQEGKFSGVSQYARNKRIQVCRLFNLFSRSMVV
jgi:dehydrogenase/reductase SDR family protein 12